VTVKHRYQRQQHQRINHKKDAVLHVVEGRDAQRNHPGQGDTHRLAKIIRRVDDIAVRGEDRARVLIDIVQQAHQMDLQAGEGAGERTVAVIELTVARAPVGSGLSSGSSRAT
jgi:hypothetical protein